MGQTRYPSISGVFKSRFPLKLGSTVKNNSALFSTQSMLNSLQNGRCSFFLATFLVHATTSKISTKNPFLYFSQFSPPNSTLTCSHQPYLFILTIPINTPFLYTLVIFHLFIFTYNHPNNLH